MKKLDLTSLEKSEIKYKINNYPDGQRDIVILDIGLGGNFYDLRNILHDEQIDYVTIKSCLNNMEDLGLIICATQALRNLGVKEIHLYTPWIMGLRSDRLFQEGGVRYIKDVLAPILNSQRYESVTCYDAHSYVAENCINNLKIIDNSELVKWKLKELYGTRQAGGPLYPNTANIILVSPDAGASHKIYKLAEKIGYKGDIITCSKERDTEGKLTKTIVPMYKYNGQDMIIIDDICDGGATFINIAKELKKISDSYHDFLNTKSRSKIYLIVTHGIFSKGLSELGEYIDGIYCTNSYQDLEPENDGNDYIYPNLVEQLNVF